MSVQFLLPMGALDRAVLSSARIRAAIRTYGKAIGYKRLGDLWGCDEATVTQKIEEQHRKAIKLHEFVAVLMDDKAGTVLAALCDELGRETPEWKQEPSTDAERLLQAAGELLAPEFVALLKHKAGL